MYWIGTSVLTQYSNLWGGLGGSGGAVQPFVLTPGSLHAFPGTASLSHDQRRFSSRLHGIKDKPRGGGSLFGEYCQYWSVTLSISFSMSWPDQASVWTVACLTR